MNNYIGYLRVSSLDQGRSGLGLEAQKNLIEEHCKQRGWTVTFLQDVASGKSTKRRPALQEALGMVNSGSVSGLIVAKLDRLSRSVIDAATLMQLAQKEGWNLCALDLGVDMSTPAGAAMAQMTAVFAELERRMISDRTKVALAVVKSRGVRLGRPVMVPTGISNRILALREKGMSYAAIASLLNSDDIPTVHNGRRWYGSSVRAAMLAA